MEILWQSDVEFDPFHENHLDSMAVEFHWLCDKVREILPILWSLKWVITSVHYSIIIREKI